MAAIVLTEKDASEFRRILIRQLYDAENRNLHSNCRIEIALLQDAINQLYQQDGEKKHRAV